MARFVGVILLFLSFTLPLQAQDVRVPRGSASARTGWFYLGGALRKGDGKKWIETSATNPIHYLELDRNKHYVELYDKQHKKSYRLYNWGMYRWDVVSEKWHLVRLGRWEDPLKKPIDAALNSGERASLLTTEERKSFPQLGEEFEVLAPATPEYNCIAWAVGKTDAWVWPDPFGSHVTVSDFDALFSSFGYLRSSSLNFDKDATSEKIVLYARINEFGMLEPTHSARQLKDGSWSSKLGRLPLIRHLHPEDLNGGTYGKVFAVYVRNRFSR